jgi:hypothetical protein
VPALRFIPHRNSRDRTRKTGASVKLDLTDEEQRTLLVFIQAALVEPKYPPSPEVEALRRVADKPRGEEPKAPRR